MVFFKKKPRGENENTQHEDLKNQVGIFLDEESEIKKQQLKSCFFNFNSFIYEEFLSKTIIVA